MRDLIPCVLSITLLAGCTNTPSDPATDDSPTYGAVLVLADQDLRYVIESERKMFEAIYADAKLEIEDALIGACPKTPSSLCSQTLGNSRPKLWSKFGHRHGPSRQ